MKMLHPYEVLYKMITAALSLMTKNSKHHKCPSVNGQTICGLFFQEKQRKSEAVTDPKKPREHHN